MMPENESPLFSIIIPTYNYGHLIQRALASVFAQSGNDYEIVIVDDGSTDNTQAIIQELREKFDQPNIRYLYQQNQGVAAARNKGVKNAVGKYILFLDADDQLLPKALDNFRQGLARTPEIPCLLGGYQVSNSHGKIKTIINNTLSKTPANNAIQFLRRTLKAYLWCMIIKRDIFENLQFPETFRKYEDLVLLTQLFALYECEKIPEIVITYHQHSDSLRNQRITTLPKPEEICATIFDHPHLPTVVQDLRNEIIARLYLANFHELYRAKQYSEAKVQYYQALRHYPFAIFKWRYLKRYLYTYYYGIYNQCTSRCEF